MEQVSISYTYSPALLVTLNRAHLLAPLNRLIRRRRHTPFVKSVLSVVPPAALRNFDYDNDHRSAGAELITITKFNPVSFLNTDTGTLAAARRAVAQNKTPRQR